MMPDNEAVLRSRQDGFGLHEQLAQAVSHQVVVINNTSYIYRNGDRMNEILLFLA